MKSKLIYMTHLIANLFLQYRSIIFSHLLSGNPSLCFTCLATFELQTLICDSNSIYMFLCVPSSSKKCIHNSGQTWYTPSLQSLTASCQHYSKPSNTGICTTALCPWHSFGTRMRFYLRKGLLLQHFNSAPGLIPNYRIGMLLHCILHLCIELFCFYVWFIFPCAICALILYSSDLW